MKLLPFLALLLLPLAALAQSPGQPAVDPKAEADWQTVLAMETGPQQAPEIRNREQGRTLMLDYLAKQETGLRAFLKDHPGSPHIVDAQLRLARLLTTQSDLTENPALFNAALHLLDEALRQAPEARRADLDFAKIALVMRRMPVPTDQERASLLAQAVQFQKLYPGDRRVPALITEIATSFDDQPRAKEDLLQQALALAQTQELRARINDDLRRLRLLGRPIEVRGTTANGIEVDLAKHRGQVVLIYFFASWSPPSMAGLEEVEYLRKTFAAENVQVIGVSLDRTREAMETACAPRRLPWPVIFDGQSWKSPLVRGLAINALPTLWMVDRKGNLRVLSARNNSEGLLRAVLKEK